MRLTLLSWARDPNGRLKSGGDLLLLRYIYSTSEMSYFQGGISFSAQSAWLSAALLFFFFCLRRDAVNPLQALRGCSIEQKRKKKICLWTVRCYWGWFLKRRKGGGGGGRVPLHVYPSNYRSSTKKKKKASDKMGWGGCFSGRWVLMADVSLKSTVKSFIPRVSGLERGGKMRSGSKSKMRELPSKWGTLCSLSFTDGEPWRSW